MTTERRLAIRIPVDKLPEELKYVTFKKQCLFAKLNPATLLDASNYGLSFKTSSIEYGDLDNGESLNLYIFSSSQKLKAKIIYTESIADGEVKVGVTFKRPLVLELYHEVLQKTGI